MQAVALCLLVAVFGMASSIVLHAASLAGVTLPDTAQVRSTTLVVNGMGLRAKFGVKVYVAGLYVTHKSSDPGAILKGEAPKQMVMQFLHAASEKQLADGFSHSFDDNAPEAKKKMKADVDRVLGALEPVKEGDQMVFTYVPAAGTALAINGTEKVTIAGSRFAQMLFSVWLGPKPPNAGLKNGILGL